MPKFKVGRLSEDHPLYRDGYPFTFVCECGFASFGWPTKKQAALRGEHHLSEHENADKIRELLDAEDFEAAGKLMMPDKAEVEQLTPDKFPVADPAVPSSPDDINSVWNAVK